jgi:hypothetical protein
MQVQIKVVARGLGASGTNEGREKRGQSICGGEEGKSEGGKIDMTSEPVDRSMDV